jgi:hypothetical protein
MAERYPVGWLPRLLFCLALALAVGLLLLVLVTPLLSTGEDQSGRLARTAQLFAQDVTLRRTALASACGLIASACVFFRPPGLPRRLSSKRRRDPPPPSVAGA